MTRRITLAILATVWATLVAGGTTAYLTTRQVLLENLDESLVARAAMLPDVIDDASGKHFTPLGALREGDRYLVQNDIGRTMARPTTSSVTTSIEQRPRLVRAGFTTLPDGTRARNVTIQTAARPLARTDASAAGPVSVTITFTSSAADFDRLLNR